MTLRKHHPAYIESLHNGVQGFALIEVMVALAIMALVGIMAWRGMDVMIRGREAIERRANQDDVYFQLVKQFERDCQEILRRDEMTYLSSAVLSSSANTDMSALAFGTKNIWLIRRYSADKQDSWMVVGYGISTSGLLRWASRPLLRRADGAALWSGISRDPDLVSSDILVSLEVPTIARQSFQVKAIGGTSGVSASGTGTSELKSAQGNLEISNVNPDQQGVVMQWWINGVSLPITRSCLMGGAL